MENINTSDKKLLELAAFAVGFNIEGFYCDGTAFGENVISWNPLEDDGDALRLAVKLCLTVRIIHDYHCYAEAFKEKGVFSAHTCKEPILDDPHSATRRAIVRAAAEIGKSMKGTVQNPNSVEGKNDVAQNGYVEV